MMQETSYLLLHGSPGNAGDWELLLQHAPPTARILCLELPDHGARPPEAQATAAAYERATFVALDTDAHLLAVTHAEEVARWVFAPEQ